MTDSEFSVMLKVRFTLYTILYVIFAFIVDEFVVVHQSEPVNELRENDVLPIFCIASNHNVQVDHQWKREGWGDLGLSSPVLYVIQPGVYVCRVTDEMDRKCMSQQIKVLSG